MADNEGDAIDIVGNLREDRKFNFGIVTAILNLWFPIDK